MSKFSTTLLFMCLLNFSWAQTTYTVTNSNDSGPGSLRQAILDAEVNPGADIIDLTGLTGTITLSTGLPNITEDLTINGAGSTSTIIDGNNQIRPFFIGGAGVNDTNAPVVNINDLTIQNGYAEGESPQQGNAGAGAGMGGAMFINNGDVTINNVVFSGNSVLGGTGGNDRFGGGGDGGDGPFENTGGIAAAFPPGRFEGGAGGYGAGGGGGVGNFNFGGADGGRGGYGAGGGGAYGGNLGGLGSGGAAGAFGGNGGSATSIAGAGGGGGAGLGGALFIRNGAVIINNSSFTNNTATGGAGGNATPEPSGGSGQGKGGGLFNDGGFLALDNVTFTGNNAANAGSSTADNAGLFGSFIDNDQVGPVATFSPEDQATGIVKNTTITITLDETPYLSEVAVTQADIALLVTLKQGTSDGADIAFTATFSGNVITITPINELNIQETYFVTLGTVDDFFGNTTGSQTISFMTVPNQPPTFTVSQTEFNLLEGAVSTSVQNWLTNIDDGDVTETQNTTTSLEVVTGADLFVDGIVPQVLSNGALTFTAGTNANGTAEVLLTVTDDGPGNAATSELITINITNVNDRPIINGDTDIDIAEDAGTQVILPNHFEFLSGEGESGQSFTVTVDPSGFNDVFTNVAIATDGTVIIDVDASRFWFLNDNANTVIQFEVTDDGGTANNGEDTRLGSIRLNMLNNVNEPAFFAGAASGSLATTDETEFSYEFDVWDEDSETLVVSNIQKPDWFTFDLNGGLFSETDPTTGQEFNRQRYRLRALNAPGDVAVGVNTFSFEVNGEEISFDITVADEDSPPTGTPVNTMSVDEGSGEKRVLLIENLSDGDALMEQELILDQFQFRISGVSINDVFITQPTLDLTTGEIVFELQPDFNGGPINFTFTIYDDLLDQNEGENEVFGQNIPLTINSVEDFPELVSEIPAEINEGVLFRFPLTTRDGDGDEVTIEVTSTPSWISLVPDLGTINTLNTDHSQFLHSAVSPVTGLLYFYDGQRIYRLNEDNTTTHIAGGGSSFSGENVDGTTLNINVSGMAFDSEGNFYYSDLSRRTIRRIDENNLVTTYAGVDGQSASSYETGPTGSTRFNLPSTIQFDSEDNLYVYERQFDALSKISDGVKSATTYTGEERFGIGYDDYIWEYSFLTADNFLKQYDLTGALVETHTIPVGGFFDIAFTPQGEVILANRRALRRYFPLTGKFETLASGFGDAGDGEAVGNALFNEIFGMDTNLQGEIILGDRGGANPRLRIVENVADRAIGGLPTEAEVGPNTVILTLTDSKGNETIVDETITVINVQNDPTGITLTPMTLDEDAPVGTTLTLAAIDTDLTETYTYTLVAGLGDDDNDAFSITGDQLTTLEVLRFETQASYAIRVRVDDSGGGSEEVRLIIGINNVLLDPTDINLSSNVIFENSPAQTLVGTFSSVDQDATDTFTYTLVTGEGDTDNASFTIVGDQIFSDEPLDFEEGASRSIRVKSLDSQGGFLEKAFTLNVADLDDLPSAGLITATRTALEDTESFFSVNPRDDDGEVTVNVTSPDWLSFQDFGDGTVEFFTGTSRGFLDGNVSTAQFSEVLDGVYDEAGNLFVADQRNKAVRRISPSGEVTTIAGLGPNADGTVVDGKGTAASINFPTGIARDDEGNLYVAVFRLIRKIDKDLNVTTFAGGVDPDSGTPIFGSVDGVGSAARFSNLRKIVFGPDGYLYVADGSNIRRISKDGEVTTFTDQVSSVTDMDWDAEGNLYVADDGNRVLRKFYPDGTHTIVAGKQGIFNRNFTTEITPALDFEFGTVHSVSFDPNGDLLIVNNNTIYRLVDDETIIPVMGFGIVSPTLNFPGFQNNVRWIEATDYGFIAFNSLSVQQFFEISIGQALSGTPTSTNLGVTTVAYTVTDGTGNTANESFDIEVLNTNDAPTGVALDDLTVDELRLPGELVGTLSTSDEDPGDTFTYTLVSGAGDTDNARFNIDGDQLLTAETFNFNSQTYSVRVQTQDAEGETFEDSFTITVNDVTDAPPQLGTPPILSATEGVEYNYAFEVQDFDTPPIFVSGSNTFELVTATGTTVPDWLTLNTTPGGLNELLQFELPFKIDPNTNTYYGLTGLNVITSVLGTTTITPLLPSDDLTLATDLAINPNGDVYVVDGQDIKTISGGVLSTLHTFTGTMQRIEFHPDGFLVYIIHTGSQFDLKKLTLAGVESTLASNINYDYGFDVSPNGTIAYAGYVGTNDYEVLRHDATGAALTNISLDLKPWFEFTTDEVSLYLINELAYNASGELYMHIIAAEMDGTLYDMIIDPAEEALWTSNDSYSVGRLEFNGTSLNFQAPGSNPMVTSIFAFEGPKYALTGTPAREDVGTNSVTLTLTDQNSTVPVSFDIEVDFVNGAPTDINISGTSIDENNVLDVDLLTFATVDPDSDFDTFTYELVSGAGDADNSEFEIVDDGLRAIQVFDAESDAGTKSIRVRTTDAAGETVEASFVLNINDVNDAPTAIALSGDLEVEENLAAGTVIGTLTTTGWHNLDRVT